jgi:uncharacterized membrane protein
MSRFASHLRARPRLAIAMLVGIAAALLLPATLAPVTRCLLGWNATVWLYLILIGWMMLHADPGHLRRVAVAQAEGALTVMAIVSAASVVSLVGTVMQLSAAKAPGAANAASHVVIALATVAGSWLLLPTVFTLTYASVYYRVAHGSGLQFPGADDSFKPDFGDFLYFSFTIAVASQTSDVNASTPAMRRLVLLQSVLSFAFNTAVLALTVNIAASMF